MSQKLEELRVYQQAAAFWESVNALLDRPGYRRNRKLAEQTSDASDSIPANISEGFEQGTDAAFAQYLFIAKGSLGEVLSRLREARSKRYITQHELDERLKAGTSLSRSLGAFIRYLDGCNYRDRGRYKSRQRQQQRVPPERGTDTGTRDEGTRDEGTRDEGTRDLGRGDPGPGTRDPGPRDPDRGTQDPRDPGTKGPV